MKKIIIAVLMLISIPVEAGNGERLRKDVIPAGDGWYCQSHYNGDPNTCEREARACQPDADMACSDLPQAFASCLTYHKVLQDEWSYICFDTVRDCKDSRKAAMTVLSDDIDHVSLCTKVK
jgi:hypothetical protein